MEVGNIITLVLHGRKFNSKVPFFRDIMAKLWKHSVGCAIGAQWLAKECGFQSMSNEAFIAGLLHDVGKLFLLTVIEKIKTSGKLIVQPSVVLINQVMETLHMEQGHTLMTNWNLPESYCIIARDHHMESITSDDNLLTLVKMANKACNKIGIGSDRDESLMLAATPEAHYLGLSEVSIAKLEIKLEDSLHLCQ
jgi:HD-like signal output (HDOD) protein